MKADYKIPLQVVVNSLHHYHQIEAQVEETDGIDFFPGNVVESADKSATYTLRFNPKVQTLLALYNLALNRTCDTGEAILRYALFHACLEMDDYTQARTHLDAFRRATVGLHLSDEQRENAGAQLLIQLYFLLFHESFHIILRQHPEQRPVAFDTTARLLLDIKTEWEDGQSLISREELLQHPKTREHIANMIPRELSEAERKLMEYMLYRELSANDYSPACIDRVLRDDKPLLEEITCDRQAWLNLLFILQGDGAVGQDLLQIHLWMFAVFNAMDFNRVLQLQFVPSYHGKVSYDDMRVVLRHKAFKALLRQYSPEVSRLLKSEYLDLNEGLESVYRSAIAALFRHADGLASLYAKHREGISMPDFAQLRQLENEMTQHISAIGLQITSES